MRIRSCLPLLLLATLVALPTVAQSPEAAHLMNAVYLGNGRALGAESPRQLSLNAHVQEFAYQPGGLEIAYTGGEGHDARGTGFVRLVGVRRGETVTLLSEAVDFPAQAIASGVPQAEVEQQMQEARAQGVDVTPPSPFTLYGWTGEGRYLLVKDTSVAEDAPAFFRVDVGASPAHVTPVPLPATAKDGPGFTFVYWSPQHTQVLFARPAYPQGADGKRILTTTCFCYDPVRDRVKTSVLAPEQGVLGWRDESHWLLQDSHTGRVEYVSHDMATGQDALIAKPTNMPDNPTGPGGDSAGASPTTPYLTLDVQAHTVVDQQKVASVESHVLWVRRTQGPKPLSAVSVGLTPGDARPQAVWSPKGTQVAYVSHGDLFVTDLSLRPATVRERYAAGEHLPCPEERQLVADNAKQIGLAMLMYVQDWDEHFPPAGGPVSDRIAPYIKSTDVFSLGSSHFVYQGPVGQSLASVDKPAETVLGTYDVPCARIVLYADGHVKEFPKPGPTR